MMVQPNVIKTRAEVYDKLINKAEEEKNLNEQVLLWKERCLKAERELMRS